MSTDEELLSMTLIIRYNGTYIKDNSRFIVHEQLNSFNFIDGRFYFLAISVLWYISSWGYFSG